MKFNLLLISIFLTIIIYAEINHETGMINSTKLNGEGCICHNQYYNDSVYVWIEGPDSVFIGDTVQFKLFMTGGPAVAGGFNIATYFGILNSIDTTTQVISGELTHTMPNPFANDTATWNFLYTTPDSIVADTLYSVANSVNGNGNPTLDEWNFGENFAINVIDQPVDLKNNRLHPADFTLYQNYPNPFNPTTNFRFRIADFGFVSLKVYDTLGNEVATLVNDEKPAGEYELEFFASELSSGIYLYKLSTRGFSETKKMILMK